MVHTGQRENTMGIQKGKNPESNKIRMEQTERAHQTDKGSTFLKTIATSRRTHTITTLIAGNPQ